jgi:hypothetical protein
MNIIVYILESIIVTTYNRVVVWDIFPIDAIDKLNQFLYKTIAIKIKYFDNPILY